MFQCALSVLSNHLSETASQDQPVNEDALTQTFDLPPDEKIIGLFKKTFPDNYLKSRTSQCTTVPSAKSSDSETHQNIGHGGDCKNESSIKGTLVEQTGGGKDGGGGDGSSVPDELLAKIECHSVLDGCVLITDAAIYQCRPR